MCHLFVAVCPDPAQPANGVVVFTGNSVGDTATYSCDAGFELVGSASATCTESSASFEPGLPTCRGK